MTSMLTLPQMQPMHNKNTCSSQGDCTILDAKKQPFLHLSAISFQHCGSIQESNTEQKEI